MIINFIRHIISYKIKVASLEITSGALFLYILIPFIGESWQRFNTPYYNSQQWDWFYDYEWKDQPRYLVNQLSMQVMVLLFAVLALIWGWEKRARRIIGCACVSYAVIDLFFWFYNYKQLDYYLITYPLVWAVEFIGWIFYFKYKDKSVT